MEATLDFLKLTQTMHYKFAVARFESLCDAPIGTPEADEAEVLAILIDSYEKEHFPIGLPHPIEAIKIRMKELGLKNNDLVAIIGYDSPVSELLSGKRKLTLKMIRRLHKALSLPLEVLIQDY